ncbi:MAG: hypothetical protein AAB131_02465 [Actinomycetota bacterium]
MRPASNNSIADVADVVFANSSSYHVELPMVGREAETELLLDLLQRRGEPHAVGIQAPLGAGKTFFLNRVLGLHRQTHPEFDEQRDCHFLLATDLEVDDEFGADVTAESCGDPSSSAPVDLESPFVNAMGRQVLVVEELDRKATLGQIRWSLAAGVAWLGRRSDRLLIVTGDMTIGGRHVREFLQLAANRHWIALDPLDLALLKDALRSRVLEKLLAPANPTEDSALLEGAASAAADAILNDPLIRWSAVPSTSPPLLATFRDALGVLRTYAENAPSNSDAILFGAELVQQLSDVPAGLVGQPAELEAALVRVATEAIRSRSELPAFSVAELATLAGHELTSTYSRRVVRPLVRKALLVPLGIPYEHLNGEGEPSALAEPFMPSYRMMHRILRSLALEVT